LAAIIPGQKMLKLGIVPARLGPSIKRGLHVAKNEYEIGKVRRRADTFRGQLRDQSGQETVDADDRK
jgi:hypothetical protein